ncbi:MAG: DUF1385 domain-containing protein [Clostridiales bacterium]|jgi:uncharacterized protein YqhQ|nr:DUF1385 domain-containing protein [Clostridiales bacterium]
MSKMDREPKRICNVGGEALIEGIMMRGPEGYAVVVRDTKGELVIEKTKQKLLASKNTFLGLPLVRGSVGLIDSMSIGVKSLFRSAELSGLEDDPDYKPSKLDKFVDKKFGDKSFKILMYISLIIGAVIAVGLFILLPNFIATLIVSKDQSWILFNCIEGLVKIVIFMGYLVLMSCAGDIKRVFMYHGAEHKTIHCYESEEELTVENVRKHTRFHPRCGTAFLFVFIIISIIIFSFLPRFDNLLLNSLFRILLIPVVAGIAYEFNRYAGRSNSIVARILRAPGLGMQRFTTKEPDDSMIEVAIASLNEALAMQKEDLPLKACGYESTRKNACEQN